MIFSVFLVAGGTSYYFYSNNSRISDLKVKENSLSKSPVEYHLQNQLFTFQDFGIKFSYPLEWGKLKFDKLANFSKSNSSQPYVNEGPDVQIFADTVSFNFDSYGNVNIVKFIVDPQNPRIVGDSYEDTPYIVSMANIKENLLKSPGVYKDFEIIKNKNGLKMIKSLYEVPGYLIEKVEYLNNNRYYEFENILYSIDRKSVIPNFSSWISSQNSELQKQYRDFENLIQSVNEF